MKNNINTARILIPTMALALLGACSTTPERHADKQRPLPETSFETKIRTSGIKSFTYAETMPRREGSSERSGKKQRSGGGASGGERGGGRSRGGGGRSDSKNSKRKEQMLLRAKENLELELARTEYCREGYLEMDTEINRGSVIITGDCNERASPEDFEKFSPDLAE